MVDESATGSANFFGPGSVTGSAGVRLGRDGVPLPGHPPSAPASTRLLWGVILGAYVWIGLLAIGTGGGSAFLFGLVSAVLIFFFVRLCGEDQLRRD